MLKVKIMISACTVIFLLSGAPVMAGCENASRFVEIYLESIPALRTSDERDSEYVTDRLMTMPYSNFIKDISCLNIRDQQRIVSALRDTYRDDRFYVRMNALILVRDFKIQDSFDLILAGLDDRNEVVRFVAAQSLRMVEAESLFLVRMPEAIAPLIEMLKNDRSAIGRGGAAIGLAVYQSAEVADALIYALLNDDDADVRAYCADSLGVHQRYFPPRSARVDAALEEALNDIDETVRTRARDALEQ